MSTLEILAPQRIPAPRSDRMGVDETAPGCHPERSLTHSLDHSEEGLAMQATQEQTTTQQPAKGAVAFLVTDLTAPCWLWPGRVDDDGYGKWCGHSAHRELWERLFSVLPDEIQLDHLCRVRNCVNPAHLEPVTGGVNTRRRLISRPRSSGIGGKRSDRWRDQCPNGHVRTPENTSKDPNGTRRCLTCRRITEARRPKRIRTRSTS